MMAMRRSSGGRLASFGSAGRGSEALMTGPWGKRGWIWRGKIDGTRSGVLHLIRISHNVYYGKYKHIRMNAELWGFRGPSFPTSGALPLTSRVNCVKPAPKP